MDHFTFISLCLMPMFLSLSGVECYTCPIDWLSRNGFCYKLFDDPKTWPDAEMFCRKHKPGCHLVSIHSAAESADLAEYVSDYLKSNKNVWIGMNDPEKNRTWAWTDRSSTNYTSWNEGEPNNSWNKEYCVHLLTLKGYHKWNDTPCESLFSFICKCRF